MARESNPTTLGPSLQVLDRTFAVLALFTAPHPEWTTTEVARVSGLPIPTAHRILATLRRHGYLSRDQATKRFRLGPAALELGERARAVVDMRAVAEPVLRRLVNDSGETAILTVLNDQRDRSVCLERVESPQPLRLSIQPGRQTQLHAGASQKVLLAYMREDEIQRTARRPLERLCSSTITDGKALKADLAAIKERGWAESFEETNTGVWGLAVPILDASGDVVAGVGLAGPSARLSDRDSNRYLGMISAAAAEIARTMGFTVPPARLNTARSARTASARA